jgi:hypothetical protein
MFAVCAFFGGADRAHRCKCLLYVYTLGGFIVLRSSMKEYVAKDNKKVIYRYLKGSYLVVFDKPIKWETTVKIMNWVALESENPKLQSYVRMRCIKQTSTVRISPKENKPIPKIVFRYGSQDRQIKKFLETKRFVLDSLRKIRDGD